MEPNNDQPVVDVFAQVTPDYINEYEEFIKNYRFTEVSGEEVGFLVARMSMYFTRYNNTLKHALRNYSIIMRDFQLQSDENGKPMSSSKAEVLAAATDQAYAYSEAKINVANLEQNINSLKALQKGINNEYAYAGTGA